MVHCDMCGIEVPAGSNGRCFIGHPLGGLPVQAPEPVVPAVETPPAGLEPPLVEQPVVAPPPLVQSPPAPVAQAPAPVVVAPPLVAPPPFMAPQPVAAEAPAAPRFLAPSPLGATPIATPQPSPETTLTPSPTLPVYAPPAPVAPAPVPIPVAPLPVTQPLVPPAAVAAPGLAPVNETVGATALAPVSHEQLDAPVTTADFFVVSGGKASKSRFGGRRQPLTIGLAVVLAILVAFVGYRAVSSTFGGSALVPAKIAPISPAGSKPVRLFTVGESHPYKLGGTLTFAAAGSKSLTTSFELAFTEKVLSVQTGVATVKYSFDHFSVSVGGRAVPLPQIPGTSLVARVDRFGHVLSSTKQGADLSGTIPPAQMLEMLSPVLPRGVSAGSVWSSSKTANLPLFDQPLKAQSAFRLASVNGDRATVHVAQSVPFSLRFTGADLAKAKLGNDLPPGGVAHVQGRLTSATDETVSRANGRVLGLTGHAQVSMRAWVEGVKGIFSGTMTMTFTLTEGSSGVPSASV